MYVYFFMYVCMYVLYAWMYFLSLIAYSSIQLLSLQVCFNKFSSVQFSSHAVPSYSQPSRSNHLHTITPMAVLPTFGINFHYDHKQQDIQYRSLM